MPQRGRLRVTRPSTARSHCTTSSTPCGRFRAVLHLLAVETAAEEGRKTVLVMLVVGLVFVTVVALGELTHWLRARRKH